jgi:hypothetical protein
VIESAVNLQLQLQLRAPTPRLDQLPIRERHHAGPLMLLA